jgi:hypothetical protein
MKSKDLVLQRLTVASIPWQRPRSENRKCLALIRGSHKERLGGYGGDRFGNPGLSSE